MPDFSVSRSEKPVIWTICMTRLEQLFRDVTPEYDDRASVHNLQGGYEEAISLLDERLRRQPCDVIIAAGSNGSYIKKRIDKPMVLVEPSGFDLMQSLNRARLRIQHPEQRIAVVTHQHELPTFVEFCDAFGLDIEHHSFQTVEDARARVAELKQQQVGAVVGTGLVTQMAEDMGLAGILLYSPDSVRRAFNTALEMVSALNHQPPRRPTSKSRRGNAAKYGIEQLLGESTSIQAVRQKIRDYAATDTTVLVHGETGTGKELVAQAIHLSSARRRQAFIAINCGAIAESLLESELFGYEEGAFTGARRGGRLGLIEAADKGTLFLDEIGEMPLPLQTRLLRVLEEREVLRVGSNQPIPLDIRIITASHCDLDQMIAKGEFRADLYYRLNVLRINLPKLCDRTDDLSLLFTSFCQPFQPHSKIVLDAQALATMQAYAWPGNLRELKNLAERLTLRSRLDTAHTAAITITLPMLRSAAPELFDSLVDKPAHLPPVAPNDKQRSDLQTALRDTLGNRELAAQQLGISRSTLWRRMRKHGLVGDE